MQIKTFKPQNKELQRYIDSFYILEHSRNEKKVSYLTFPSIITFVSVELNSESIITSKKIITKFSKSKSINTGLVCRFNKPICFQYEGDIKEICIYFKPLGLNAFLEKSLETYSTSYYDSFVPFLDYEKSMSEILKIEDKALLAQELEAYWATKIIGFEHPFLYNAIHLIQENYNIKTSDLAEECKVSQKTLISHFKKHLCKTPSEYKKILRFRNALSVKHQSNQNTKLSELSYIIEFFDQSHMVGDFKSLTGFTPKAFFKDLKTIEGSNIHWIYS
ncbi:MAG: helix-turn-helix transcriptional regulator [Bacteroidetes bacterium]|nr:helix-turn-helix transcriptional regulator [Bacteroidota bacterium]